MRKKLALVVLALAAVAALSGFAPAPASADVCPVGTHLIVCPTHSFCCPNNAFCVCFPGFYLPLEAGTSPGF